MEARFYRIRTEIPEIAAMKAEMDAMFVQAPGSRVRYLKPGMLERYNELNDIIMADAKAHDEGFLFDTMKLGR